MKKLWTSLLVPLFLIPLLFVTPALSASHEPPKPVLIVDGPVEEAAEPQPTAEATNSQPASDAVPGSSVYVMGFSRMLLPPGVEQADLYLANPAENEGQYYLTFSLRVNETGEVLFTTGLIPPGMHCTSVNLTRPLEVGTYACKLIAQPYTMTADPQPVNQMELDMELVVSEE